MDIKSNIKRIDAINTDNSKKSKRLQAKKPIDYQKFSQSGHNVDSPILQPISVNSESNSQISIVNEQSIALASQELSSDEDLTVSSSFVANKYKILRRIPKGARFEACKELTKVVMSINKENTPKNWLRLFYFAPNCLAIPNKTRRNSPSMATIVKRNVVAYSKCVMPTYPKVMKNTCGRKKSSS